MKIVTPTEANTLIQKMIANGKDGVIDIGFKPDYRLDTTGLADVISTMGWSTNDVETGSYILDKENKPYIFVNIFKVDWYGNVVDYDFPNLGNTINDVNFRWNSNLAYTVNVTGGTKVSLKELWVCPDYECNLKIAWGDNNNVEETSTTASEISHTYTNDGTYTIFIQGDIINSSNTGRYNDNIVSIHFVKPLTIYSTWGLFRNFRALETVIGTVKPKVYSQSTLRHLFNECPNITNIKGFRLELPTTFLRTSATPNSFQQVFGDGCQADYDKKATLIKDFNIINHDRNAIINLDSAFQKSNINIMPFHLFGKNVQNGYHAFKNSPKISYIPQDTFNELTNGEEMFYCDGDGSELMVSPLTTFNKLQSAPGMFGNRTMTFSDIKTVFESLPENTNLQRGKTGVSVVDNVNPSNCCITFSFNPLEPNIKRKLIEYFNLNTTAMINYHNNNKTYYGSSVNVDKTWDGGWYPIYNTFYGHSWDCNNSKKWWVNFRQSYNYS